MSNVVILAEKPSQALAYGSAFKIVEREKSYISIDKCSTFPDGALITWGVGHLVELVTPDYYDEKYKSWSIKNLPIIPEKFNFKYQVRNDVKSHYNSIVPLLKNAKTIVVATDAGVSL